MVDVRVRTLQRAAEIMGGEQQLAFHLKVTPSHLALWLQGAECPPDQIFLKAVDLVTEHDVLRPLPERRPCAPADKVGPVAHEDGPVYPPDKHATSR